MNTVELSVRSKLMQVVEELQSIAAESERVSENLNGFAKQVGKTTESQIKKTETFLGRLRSMMGSVAKSMADDFKALFSVVGISEGLKLGNVFRDNIKETFELSDTIRKLGSVFGITQDRFVTFQQKLTQGLGEIGLSSESAVNSLKGLSETQVRGEGNLVEYSKTAGMLAGATGQRGREGDIAKGLAETLTAQGKNPNDVNAMKGLAEDIRKAFNATGAGPTEVLSKLKDILASMPADLRKSLSTTGLVGLGAAGAVGGPNATKFLEEYLSKSPIARAALDARGFKGVVGKDGLDIEKFRKAAKGVMDAFPGDPRLMAQTLGLSEDAAEGFVRLYESLDRVRDAQDKMRSDNQTLKTQYEASMTASEAFSASLNKLKASLAKPIALTTNFITDGLQSAFKTSLDDLINLLPQGLKEKAQELKNSISAFLPDALDKNLGSTAVVAGGGLLAATLAGGGINNLLKLGKGKAGGVAERMAYEQVTGAKVSDVYVVNAGEIGAAMGGKGPDLGAASSLGGKLGSFVKGIAGVTGAGAAGYQIGTMVNDAIEGTSVGKGLDKAAGWLGEKVGEVKESIFPSFKNESPKNPATGKPKVDVNVKVHIETKNKDLKATIPPGRGASQ